MVNLHYDTPFGPVINPYEIILQILKFLSQDHTTTSLKKTTVTLPDGHVLTDETVTDVTMVNDAGQILGHLGMLGDPLGLEGPPGAVTGFWLTSYDGVIKWQISGFAAMDADLFKAKFISPTTTANLYLDFVALTNSGATAHGGNAGDVFDLGNRADTVFGGGGDDQVNKIGFGSVTFTGGSGIDTISFQAADGSPFVNPFTQTMVVNLITGKGRNPYGGTLTLQGVEDVVGTSAGDLIIGNGKPNNIGDGFFDGGADTVRAGGGDDTVLVTDLDLARADGGAGYDTLVFFDNIDLQDASTAARYQNFELFRLSTIYLGSAGFSFGGNALGNTFIGGDGVDTFTGRGGNDTLWGGYSDFGATVGSDVAVFSGNRSQYTIVRQGATVTVHDNRPGAADGTDTLFNIETLRFADKDVSLATLFPNIGVVVSLDPYSWNISDLSDKDDSYYGTDGDDDLGAEGGRNLLVGGKGDDTYYVTDTKDIIIEEAGEGTDTLKIAFAAVAGSYSIAGLAHVENIDHSGGGPSIRMTGNALANQIMAGDGDTLYGAAGNDTLTVGHSSQAYGGKGNDLIISYVSGYSNDTLSGGNGADIFVFTTVVTSAPTPAQPVITDFNGAEGDHIDLSRIDPIFGGVNDAFTWRGTQAFTDVAQVRVVQEDGKTYLEINILGSDTAEARIEFKTTTLLLEGYFTL